MKKELHVDIKNLEQKAIELNQQKYELIKEIGELADEIIDEFIQQQIANKKEYLMEVWRFKELLYQIKNLDPNTYSYYTIILDKIETKLQ